MNFGNKFLILPIKSKVFWVSIGMSLIWYCYFSYLEVPFSGTHTDLEKSDIAAAYAFPSFLPAPILLGGSPNALCVPTRERGNEWGMHGAWERE